MRPSYQSQLPAMTIDSLKPSHERSFTGSSPGWTDLFRDHQFLISRITSFAFIYCLQIPERYPATWKQSFLGKSLSLMHKRGNILGTNVMCYTLHHAVDINHHKFNIDTIQYHVKYCIFRVTMIILALVRMNDMQYHLFGQAPRKVLV